MSAAHPTRGRQEARGGGGRGAALPVCCNRVTQGSRARREPGSQGCWGAGAVPVSALLGLLG